VTETIRQEVWIKAPAAVVFDALTTRTGLDGWWGKVVTAERRIGHVIEFDHGHGDLLRMRVEELIPGERVVWHCLSDFGDTGNPASEWLGHRLSFDVRPPTDGEASSWLGRHLYEADQPDDAAILTFRHAGWSPDSRWYAFCNAAWGSTLEELRLYCEQAAG
jgi:uncharacterized protein YndB with AHSA1/START domain